MPAPTNSYTAQITDTSESSFTESGIEAASPLDALLIAATKWQSEPQKFAGWNLAATWYCQITQP